MTVPVVGFLLLAATAMAQNAEVEVLKGNGKFTNNLYKVLSEAEPGKNVFFSPISAHAVLSMAYQGAQGTTAEAFGKTLNVPQAKQAAEGYSAIQQNLNNVPNVTLLIANRVFIKEGVDLLPEFNKAVTNSFQSKVQAVDFTKASAAAKTINTWVEDKTNEKIKDLISPDDLDENTRLVLVNAIYFKGEWAEKFDKSATKTEKFYINSNNDTVDVDMMKTQKSFNYKFDNNLDAQVLELPYKNKDVSMIVILPSKRDGIKDLETKLQTVDLTTITDGMYNSDVIVSLPKFKIEQTINLKDSLTKLGLGEIFDEGKANFRGIIPLQSNENLYVSKAIQKAFIEVSEEGAEAAAATGLHEYHIRPAPPRVTVRFNVDHEFIFTIILKDKYKSMVTPLFFGKAQKV